MTKKPKGSPVHPLRALLEVLAWFSVGALVFGAFGAAIYIFALALLPESIQGIPAESAFFAVLCIAGGILFALAAKRERN